MKFWPMAMDLQLKTIEADWRVYVLEAHAIIGSDAKLPPFQRQDIYTNAKWFSTCSIGANLSKT